MASKPLHKSKSLLTKIQRVGPSILLSKGEEMKKRLLFLSTVFNTLVLNTISVYATGLKSTKLYTGTMQLIADAQSVLLAVEAAFVVVLLIWQGMKMQAAEQEEKPRYKKNMWGIGITGVIIISLTAVVPVILAYYQ